uniref:Uncharacterized protein n=1 Tax=Haptolina ericina TaxID=156174 RepID=A0A7S3AI93_9EUKA
MIEQILEREQAERFNYLANAEWTGKRFANFEHLQGRGNNLTYHFMFALEEEQPTEDVNGFLACYQTSQQSLDEIIALIPIPYQHIRLCAILVRLVYALGYVRKSIQTEASISLLEKMEYNEVIDNLFDKMTESLQGMRQSPRDVSLELSSGLYALVQRARIQFPHLTLPGGVLARDVPLMVHIMLLSQVWEKECKHPGHLDRVLAQANAGTYEYRPGTAADMVADEVQRDMRRLELQQTKGGGAQGGSHGGAQGGQQGGTPHAIE